jgi:hypothetical protein
MHDKSEAIGALAEALALAQGEIENAAKKSSNPHFRSKYADLAEVINTARPVLAKYGLSVTQWPSYADGIVSVETILAHKSGEWISNTASAPADKLNAQGVGSATTYLRRYSLAALACIAQEDDDGNKASEREGPVSARKSAAQAKRDGDAETVKRMLTDASTAEDLDARWQVVQSEWLPILPEKWEDVIHDFYLNARDALKAKGA